MIENRKQSPVRTVLVDDEPLALDNLRVGLREHDPLHNGRQLKVSRTYKDDLLRPYS